MRRLFWALPLWLASSLAFGQTTTTEVVEFYHEGLDHYFITADAREIGNLDTGVLKGWTRTGQKFVAVSPGSQVPGALGVCRFYGKPERGLDSHFYPATLAECVAVREKFPDTWLFESDNVFKLYLPDQNTGVCPGSTVPVYRAWNNRPDVNHRYTTDRSVHLSMLAKGYIEEGFGGNGKPVVAMCAVSASNPVGAGLPSIPIVPVPIVPVPIVPVPGVTPPECTLAADNLYPKVGSTVTLTASCTNSPTKYVWSEASCSTATGSCTLTGSAIGYKNYTVKGGNAGGEGAAVGVLVQWQPATVTGPPPPAAPTVPSCTILSNTPTPVIATNLVLTASCTGSPTSYTWTGCPGATGRTCTTSEASEGSKTYTVTATNAVGNSSPTSMTASWVKIPPPVGVNCTIFPNPVSPVIGASLTLTATCVGNPTTFVWESCSSTTSSCTPTTQTRAGSLAYVLTASNASGSSHRATVLVTWQDPPPPPGPTPTGCQIEVYPAVAVPRLTGLYMNSPNIAVKFKTPNYTSSGLGKATSVEYIGEQRYREASISDQPCDFSFSPGTGNLSGPGTTTYNLFTVGRTQAGIVRLEPNTKYYYNLRGFRWDPADAREQFAVGIDQPLP
ncbi:MAG: hypothetical protein H0T80_07105 [Betaproteobacteria bacterium]|nr:hypothetical protein [Betaproteobacteria bacterium]